MNGYTVGQVAALAHVSVRTLHHYDYLGLLRPSARSAAGYRLYSDEDLGRLREIRFYRELDFPLDEIAKLLADPGTGTDQRLREQHRLLRRRIDRSRALLAALENEMEARDMGLSLTPEEQFEVFGTDRFAEYQDEAQQRWGDSDAWQESARRTARYTKQDWIEIKAQADATIAALAEAMRSGASPASERAMDLAEAHREHLTRWFYACGYGMHRALAELYVSDPRFAATYDEVEAGFAQYVHDAILANAERHQD
jgi:DNA-binding transcriptional MerR regulator